MMRKLERLKEGINETKQKSKYQMDFDIGLMVTIQSNLKLEQKKRKLCKLPFFDLGFRIKNQLS